MAMNKKDIDILEEIISVNGKCLQSKRCEDCPFRSVCLPEFLNVIPPTQTQRYKMAADVLSYHGLLNDDSALEEVKSSYGKNREPRSA